MKIKPFAVEEWMNAYETGAKYNIAETCVDSVSIDELFELCGEDKDAFWRSFSSRRMTYGDIEGAPEFKRGICRLYRTVKPEEIVTTHGASGANHHLFYSLLEPGDRVISIVPSYQQLYSIPESYGADVRLLHLEPENGYLPDLGKLRELVTPDTKLICMSNPNNPTGQPVDRALLETVLERCEAAGSILVLDECFVSLLDDGPSYTMKGRLDSPNLFLLKAFTKTYAMAGLRLGYCLCSNEPLLQTMAHCGQPWSVSTVAQAAGIAALQETAYVERLHQLIAAERPRLAAGLQNCGCTVLGSRANFVFFSARPGLDAALRQKGILIRSCANYHGLDETYYRVAVRTAPDNEKLLAAVSQCMEE